MRDAEKTIGNLIDKAGVSIISSVDEAGFPNTKAMIPPRKREGIKHIYFTTNTSSMRVRQYTDNPNLPHSDNCFLIVNNEHSLNAFQHLIGHNFSFHHFFLRGRKMDIECRSSAFFAININSAATVGPDGPEKRKCHAALLTYG